MQVSLKNSARFSSWLTACFILSGLILASCSYHKKEESLSGDVQVQVPVYAQGKYSMSIVDLMSMMDLVHLRGAAATVLIEPHDFKGRGVLRGRNPEIHFIRNSHGVIVPTDADSLQMLSLYAQFEKLRQLDKSLGVEKYNKWPVTVAVNALTKGASGAVEENNAFYSGQIDAYLFAPYKQSQLPLAVNSGVIGHEHFHSLFQHIVIDSLGDKYPGACKPTAHNDQARLKAFGLTGDDSADVAGDSSDCVLDQNTAYNAIVLHGLNEGLADVWGWVYSGDVDFVQRSIRSVGTTRSLRYNAVGFTSKTQFMDEFLSAESLGDRDRANVESAMPYQIGSQYARALKNLVKTHFSDLSETEQRQKAAQFVIAGLAGISEKVKAMKADDVLSPADLMLAMVTKLSDLTKDDCQFVQNLIPLDDVPKTLQCGASVGAAQ